MIRVTHCTHRGASVGTLKTVTFGSILDLRIPPHTHTHIHILGMFKLVKSMQMIFQESQKKKKKLQNWKHFRPGHFCMGHTRPVYHPCLQMRDSRCTWGWQRSGVLAEVPELSRTRL